MLLSKDWREFLLALNSHNVEYVLVGGLAVALHAVPRFTGDLDVLVRPTPDNAARILTALKAFGLGSLGVTASDLLTSGTCLQFGVRPYRIDILNSISGVDAEHVWQHRVITEMEGIEVCVIDRRSLIQNKRAAGRSKDLADVELLDDWQSS